MDRAMRSIGEFEKTYLPVLHEAKEVAGLFKGEYIKWYIATPKDHRDQIIEELRYIADEHLRARNRILRNLGYG